MPYYADWNHILSSFGTQISLRKICVYEPRSAPSWPRNFYFVKIFVGTDGHEKCHPEKREDDPMKYRLRDVIDTLEHDELVKLKKDVDSGGFHLKKFLDQKIKEDERRHEQFCTVCASDIDPYSTTTFTLVFGPDGFKKKATFCAPDCLKFFLKRMEDLKKSDSS